MSSAGLITLALLGIVIAFIVATLVERRVNAEYEELAQRNAERRAAFLESRARARERGEVEPGPPPTEVE